jgi:hypothetical protein
VTLVPTVATDFKNAASAAMKPASFGVNRSVTTVHGRPSAGFTSSVNPCASSAMTPM